MSNEEIIKEMRDLKDLLCNAVRYNPDFTENKLSDNNKSFTIAANLVAEFDNLVKLCAKGNTFDINMKKFEIKEKIPFANIDKYNEQLQLALTKVETTQKYFLNNTTYPKNTIDLNIGNEVSAFNLIKAGQTVRDQLADALSIRLTELINMIPVKKIFQKKENDTDKKVYVAQKFEHLFEIKSTLELRPLTWRDSTIQIVNLQEFSGIKFYFRKSDGFSAVFLLYKGTKEYLVADDKKLYVLNKSAELVQGTHMDKLQFWKEKN